MILKYIGMKGNLVDWKNWEAQEYYKRITRSFGHEAAEKAYHQMKNVMKLLS